MRGVVAIGASSASCCGASSGTRNGGHYRTGACWPQRRRMAGQRRRPGSGGRRAWPSDRKIIMYGVSQSQGEIRTVCGQFVAVRHRSGGSSRVATAVAVEARQKLVRELAVADVDAGVNDLDLESVPEPPPGASLGGLDRERDSLRLEQWAYIVSPVVADDHQAASRTDDAESFGDGRQRG